MVTSLISAITALAIIFGAGSAGSAAHLQPNQVVAASSLHPSMQSPVAAPPAAELSEAVKALPATSPSLDRLSSEARRARAKQGEAQRALASTTTRIGLLSSEEAALRALVARRSSQAERLAPKSDALRHDLNALVSESFMTGFGIADTLDPTLTLKEQVQGSRLRVLAQAAMADTLHDSQVVDSRLRRIRTQRATYARKGQQTTEQLLSLQRQERQQTGALAAARRNAADAAAAVEVARFGATVDGTDVSVIAVDAYYRDAKSLATTDPNCGVPWWALAGIGRTETDHGRYRGSAVAPDGAVTPMIYGPLLDGSGGFALVRDSDGGAIDATSAGDRAVGPMQFLPGTWSTVGRDATGDGTADPHNLYDAALGAGALLCLTAGSLQDEASLRRSFRRYNNSAAYVQTVWERAKEYSAAIDL